MRIIKQSSMLGVTLLEILLVLAISASIILLSVRYYVSATSSLQANSAIQAVQAITATIDSYASNGSYEGITNPFLDSLLPKGTMTTPWGTPIKIDNILASSY